MHTRPKMSWSEFRDLTYGLLQSDKSRLWRTTRPPEPEQPMPTFGVGQTFD